MGSSSSPPPASRPEPASGTRPADTDPHLAATRSYYDEFAARYEDRRGGKDPGGYHDLVDDLEVDFVRRFGDGRDVLEVGCGTGLLLARIQSFARTASGVDLSPGMLERARARGLDVQEGSATSLPFPDASFDVACSFKVLAHVEDIRGALAEMARVVRPGGHVLAEFYNPWSFRGLAKRLGPAGAISATTREDAVYTRFDTPEQAERYLPPGLRLVDARGVRIVTPAAIAMRVPVLRNALRRAEWALCDSPLHRLGGFWIAAAQKA
ncbi:class I SAM-dependent methyltransferase [Chondromyces crocatus]|uniref:3-demethylubiquinone-9 3-methyltransferase n=1 Tax=Chondromyces crocatus TaxID=52 RepID=A0A0K1EFL8_CHOCO|nr:class I SAM-dependent methyltransferase [Chondromyces crocatus]AKT39661.1 3-demethylubiquinone-9 3-methyltransferase [Chondromyces crocatus]